MDSVLDEHVLEERDAEAAGDDSDSSLSEEEGGAQTPEYLEDRGSAEPINPTHSDTKFVIFGINSFDS
jgi:hypothetical protein